MAKIQPKDGVLLPGDAVDPLDAVTKRQLDAAILSVGSTIDGGAAATAYAATQNADGGGA